MILSCELPASLPNTCAPREDIVAAFERHAAKPYIYVQAPAGYGKTVTALLWLKRTGHAFAWLSLDRYDNTPSLFYRMLCHAMLATIEPPDALTQFVNSPSFSSAPAECAMEFFLMFPWRDEKFILVLDDLHNVTSEDILRSLPYVLKKLPLTVTVLFLSRMALPDALASLTRGNAAAFIDSNDLSFTPEEIRRYFTENGQPLSKDEANGIYAQTDGWAILVNAMLASGYLSLAEGGFELSFNEFY
ncbi:MAG: hypothetical protein FWD72_02250, partial [Eggerthellaceae bacterium]|nr:hypothetical protein [Eggerthellaceae bacterium]